MVFLLESSLYTGHIVSHGFKREDLSIHFTDEAYRLLSGSCVTVFDADTDNEITFASDRITDRLNALDHLMLTGTSRFRFRCNGKPATDTLLSIQEYRI